MLSSSSTVYTLLMTICSNKVMMRKFDQTRSRLGGLASIAIGISHR